MLDDLFYKSVAAIVAIGSLILIGLPLTWLLGKAKVKITTERMLYVFFMGLALMFIGADYSLYYFGIFIMTIAVALFLSHRYITIPKKEREAEFEGMLLKGKAGLLNEDEARELLKLATKYEAKGQLSEAKYYYELIIKSDTPISADAQSCLKNPLLENVDDSEITYQLKKKIEVEKQKKLKDDLQKKEDEKRKQEASRQEQEAIGQLLKLIKTALEEITEELNGKPSLNFIDGDHEITGYIGKTHFSINWGNWGSNYGISFEYDGGYAKGFVERYCERADSIIDVLLNVIAVRVAHDGSINFGQIKDLLTKHPDFKERLPLSY